MHRTIDGGQIAFAFRKRGQNFFAGDWMFAVAKNLKDRLARRGDFAGLPAKLFGEVRQVFAPLVMRMGAFFHASLRKRTALNPSEIMKSAMQLRTIAGPQGTSRR